MKLKKASLLTKLVVLALLIGAATGLLNLRQQILTAEADFSVIEGIRGSINVFQDRRPELYQLQQTM